MSAQVRVPRDLEEEARTEGTPEHFRRFCRGQVGMTVQVHTPGGIPGFVVPRDGVWMINGLFAEIGQERDLAVGDTVSYYQSAKNPENDDPTSRRVPWHRPAVRMRLDPTTGCRLPPEIIPARR